MLTIHTKCDKCGSSLEEGYEIREHSRDENGYVDEEIICAACIEAGKPRTMIMIDARGQSTKWDSRMFIDAFFSHPERIQIESITYSESGQ